MSSGIGLAYVLLLTLLCAGFALYETGYGMCDTVFQSFCKRIASFVVSFTSFGVVVVYTNLLPVHNTATLVLNLALLTILTHIVTAISKSVVYSCAMAALVGGLIYPVLHAMIQQNGLVDATGFYDAAGSGVIHFVGAIIAFTLSLYLSKVRNWKSLQIKRPAIASLGFMLIWAAWVVFTILISAPILQHDAAAWIRGALVVSSSAAWGAASSVAFTYLMLGKAKLKSCTLGGLAGLVIVSATPFMIDVYTSLFLGIIAGVLSASCSYVLHRSDLKDPCGVIAIHGPAGVLGLLLAPILGNFSLLDQLQGMFVLTGISVVAAVIICEVMVVLHGALQFTKLNKMN